VPTVLTQCGHCDTRVLPSEDGTCPACLRNTREAPLTRVRANGRRSHSGGGAELSDYAAAVLHWRLIAFTVGQLVVSVAAVYVRRTWPRTPLSALEQRDATLDVLYLLAFVGFLVIVVHVYRLAQWLRYDSPALYSAALSVPIVGLIVLFRITKASAAEFERLGYSIYVAGPRLREIPQEGEPEEETPPSRPVG
jgi:hypothetical protein